MHWPKLLTPILLLLLLAPTQAIPLDDRLVILVVGEYRNGDERVDELRASILEARDSNGLGSEQLPVVTMGFRDSDTEQLYFSRLGFADSSAPVLCIARWANPASNGPKQVVEGAIVRSASPQDVDEMVRRFREISGDNPPMASTTRSIDRGDYRFELPSEFQVLDNSVGERLFGKAPSLVGRDSSNSQYELVAETTAPSPPASFSVVRIERPNRRNKGIRRMVRKFKKNFTDQGIQLKGPSKEEIRNRTYYKFEQSLQADGEAKRREIYFLAPPEKKRIYVFTFETSEASFVEMSPLFRDAVESFSL